MTIMPTVPPRPTRSHVPEGSSGGSANNKVPYIPPRPLRRLERSTSPHRFARSPLNEAPITTAANVGKSSLYSSESANNSASDLTRQTSNTPYPDLGQEGAEYAEIFGHDEVGTSPTKTRGIGQDVKLQAPKPSLPASSAKQRVSAVTRTDSSQAAAFGLGQVGSDTHVSQSLKSKASFASNASNGASDFVPASYESETGIPEIGQRVPMYPDAGDVQAPSPGPGSVPFTPGIGNFNDGSKTPFQNRRQSGVTFDVPLDAYGLHGHGVLPHDRLEKAYYEKHPELLKKEIDQYHERSEWAMSSEDLNRLVRDTASRGTGLGTSHVMSTPSEQVAFKASEEFTSRMNSPRLSNAGLQTDSPLEKQSQNSATSVSPEKVKFESALSKGLRESGRTEKNETTNTDTVIVKDLPHRIGKVHGGNMGVDFEGPSEHSGMGSDGFHEQFVYTAPILAEDEVAKDPHDRDLQPAVSPAFGSYNEGFYSHRTSSGTSLPGSHSNSRPGSTYGRKAESTPLDDVVEYEPLFPDEQTGKDAKPITIADKLKRPDHRRFPSQDVWEDTPNSLQYTATVSSPQLLQESESTQKSVENETPEQAFARRQEELAEQEARTPDSFLGSGNKAPSVDSASSSHGRQHSKQRFPSRDIWEDTPDSLQLQTTVGGPQSEKSSPIHDEASIAKPEIPDRPSRTKPISSGASGSPPKPKPQIPARPTRAKPNTRDSAESVPLASKESSSSLRSISSDRQVAAAGKPKPPVPQRPSGSKIAALQGGFMADLNKRLQLGPQTSKPLEGSADGDKEVEKEVKPLADARKGRARGPPRKAPAKAVEPGSTEDDVKKGDTRLALVDAVTWWELDPERDTESVLVGPQGENITQQAGDSLTEELAQAEPLSAKDEELLGTHSDVKDTNVVEAKAISDGESAEGQIEDRNAKTESVDVETGNAEVSEAQMQKGEFEIARQHEE